MAGHEEFVSNDRIFENLREEQGRALIFIYILIRHRICKSDQNRKKSYVSLQRKEFSLFG